MFFEIKDAILRRRWVKAKKALDAWRKTKPPGKFADTAAIKADCDLGTKLTNAEQVARNNYMNHVHDCMTMSVSSRDKLYDDMLTESYCHANLVYDIVSAKNVNAHLTFVVEHEQMHAQFNERFPTEGAWY